jgi:elongation factor 1-gamma
MGIMHYNKQNTDRAKDDITKALSVLNQHLETRTFFVGERISLADISVATSLALLYQWVLDPEFRQPYQNVNRWFTTCVNQPQFKAVIGDFKFCEKMAQFDAKKFQDLQGGQKGGKKPEKKQEKKAEKPKKEEAAGNDEEEEEELEEKKPSKDPFGHLPKGTMNMDEWKKTYSNNDTLSVALPYFWEHFDRENYSIWYCEYKYPEELKLIFMTCNLVSGMMQRLDRMRKHAFGSMCVFGENNNNNVSGVWFWKGHDLAFTLSDDLKVDYESYEWKKLDVNSEDTKKLVKEYFSHSGDFGGKKVNQGKVFK